MAKRKKRQSRAERFDEAMAGIEPIKDEVQTLMEELQNWLDGMPENLQDGDKATQLQEAIDNLESILQSLEEAADTNVEFPGMMG